MKTWHWEEWERFSEAQARNYAKELTNYLPQPVIFKSLQQHSFCDRTFSLAQFEYDGALFSLIPGTRSQIGYDASWFSSTEEQLASFEYTAKEYDFAKYELGDIHSYIQQAMTSPRIVEVPTMLVETHLQEIGFKPRNSQDSEILEILAEFSPNSQNSSELYLGDRHYIPIP